MSCIDTPHVVEHNMDFLEFNEYKRTLVVKVESTIEQEILRCAQDDMPSEYLV